MKIGIVCPYSFDVPGGVQFHVRDLAEELIRRGHQVSVLAPGVAIDLPSYFVSAGPSVPVPYNGSVARLGFGVRALDRTRKWLTNGKFDVVHIHEPLVPSIGLLALRSAEVPVVATFHTAMDRSVARHLAATFLNRVLERISGRIAVSQEARRTLIEHEGGDAVIIPNGVYVDIFHNATTRPEWAQTEERPVVSFLGRLDEPRKGLPVLAGAIPEILAAFPGTRFLIAGKGEASEERAALAVFGDSIEFLGPITDEEKAALLAGSTLYCAPQTGGESFGIVLVEAMAAKTVVVAADLQAFQDVLEDGKAGKLFHKGDCADLARAVKEILGDPAQQEQLRSYGEEAVQRFDWGQLTDQIEAVYLTVVEAAGYGQVSLHMSRTGEVEQSEVKS